MFDIAIQFMVQMVPLIPAYFALWVLFDLIRGLLFKND